MNRRAYLSATVAGLAPSAGCLSSLPLASDDGIDPDDVGLILVVYDVDVPPDASVTPPDDERIREADLLATLVSMRSAGPDGREEAAEADGRLALLERSRDTIAAARDGRSDATFDGAVRALDSLPRYSPEDDEDGEIYPGRYVGPDDEALVFDVMVYR